MLHIQSLTASRPIVIIGAAFGDIILAMDRLPVRGGDDGPHEMLAGVDA